MSSTLSPPPSTTRPPSSARHPWADAWLRSDLVGVPVTLALSGVVAISFGLYLVIDQSAGLFIGPAPLPARAPRATRAPASVRASKARRPTGFDVSAVAARASGARPRKRRPRASTRACRSVSDRRKRREGDDHRSGGGRHVASRTGRRRRLESSRPRGRASMASSRPSVSQVLNAGGRAELAAPATALIDGLREFAATEILVLASGGEELGEGDQPRRADPNTARPERRRARPIRDLPGRRLTVDPL